MCGFPASIFKVWWEVWYSSASQNWSSKSLHRYTWKQLMKEGTESSRLLQFPTSSRIQEVSQTAFASLRVTSLLLGCRHPQLRTAGNEFLLWKSLCYFRVLFLCVLLLASIALFYLYVYVSVYLCILMVTEDFFQLPHWDKSIGLCSFKNFKNAYSLFYYSLVVLYFQIWLSALFPGH